jgi:hypothetical protein
MPDTEFTFDTKDFEKKFFTFAQRTIPEAVRAGVFAAMTKLEQDALEVSPTVPKGPMGKPAYTPGQLRKQTIIEVKSDDNTTTGKLVYKMPYAARRHEEERGPVSGKPVKFSEPGSGPKFISTKLVRFMKDYVGIITETIKSRMR